MARRNRFNPRPARPGPRRLSNVNRSNAERFAVDSRRSLGTDYGPRDQSDRHHPRTRSTNAKRQKGTWIQLLCATPADYARHALEPRLGVSDAAKTYGPVRGVKEAHQNAVAGVRRFNLAFSIRKIVGRDRNTPHTLRYKKIGGTPRAPG